MNSTFAEVQSYQIFACQEPIAAGATAKTQTVPQWKRVGDVKALPLPMACTLSQVILTKLFTGFKSTKIFELIFSSLTRIGTTSLSVQ